MNITTQEYVTKAAIERIYINSKKGISGHFIVLFLTALLFWNKIPPLYIAIGVVSHIIILLRRAYLSYKYFKIKDSLVDIQDINRWLNRYKICMFFSGLAYGLMIFFFQDLPTEYHFLILTIVIGLSAGGIYTQGEVYSIYSLYVLSMLGCALIWMILQDAYIYTIGSVLIVVAIYYFLSSARRYANNFRDVVLEKHNVSNYIKKQKLMQAELIKQKAALEYQATHDALTGLPNRTLFNDRLEHSIEKAKRTKNKIALFFIDLDHFKEINDSLGHDVGDEVLKIATQRLNHVIRMEDTLARLGGDEFSIIMEDLHHVQDSIYFAKKILKALEEPIVVNKNQLYISSSIGISFFPQDHTQAKKLLKYADSAMYKAKSEGRNNFQFYSKSMTEMTLNRVETQASLNKQSN